MSNLLVAKQLWRMPVLVNTLRPSPHLHVATACMTLFLTTTSVSHTYESGVTLIIGILKDHIFFMFLVWQPQSTALDGRLLRVNNANILIRIFLSCVISDQCMLYWTELPHKRMADNDLTLQYRSYSNCCMQELRIILLNTHSVH